METKEIIKKHEKRFNSIKVMIRLLLVTILATIIALQWRNIIELINTF